MESPRYEEYLCTKIEEAVYFAEHDEIQIYLSKEDEPRLKSLTVKTGFPLKVSDESFIGGIKAIIPEKISSSTIPLRKAIRQLTENSNLTEVQHMSKTGIIYGVNGPVIYLKGDTGFKISEMVYVGPEKLVGEVIGLKKHMTTIQVFEETTGLKPGETVIGTGDAISVLLGPGIIHNIFDGIQRPLAEIAQASGKYISRGVSVDSLDTEKNGKPTLP